MSRQQPRANAPPAAPPVLGILAPRVGGGGGGRSAASIAAEQRMNAAYDKIKNLVNTQQLNPGTDSRGNQYNRKFNYQPGGEEMMRIVAGLGKDLKRVNGIQTKTGAERWIDQNKKKNWQVIEADVTGPEGRPDGLKEVMITDARGNLRAVNGYMLRNNDYPYRKEYYATYDDPMKQAETPYSLYRQGFKEIKTTIGDDGVGEYQKTAPVKTSTFISYPL